MKKIMIGGLFLAIVGIVMIGCEKEEVTKKLNPVEAQKLNDKSEYLYLSETEIENIGVLHNQYLDLLFKNFDYSTANTLIELEDNFNSILNNEDVEISFQDIELKLNENINLLTN